MKPVYLKRFIIIVTLMLPGIINSTPPSIPMRNIDGELRVIRAPEKVGDTLEVAWDFFIKPETNRILKSSYESLPEQSVKVIFNPYPRQEYIQGDTLWWGKLEYYRLYSFRAVFKITTPGRLYSGAIIETYSQSKYGRGRITSNSIKGRAFDILDENGNPIEPEIKILDTMGIRIISGPANHLMKSYPESLLRINGKVEKYNLMH